jgi:pimeloyl-ACP methyl ester carboxylesterase
LIHGAGDVGWYWHLVDAELRDRGHDVVAPDLPSEDGSAGWSEYADAVIEAIDDARGLRRRSRGATRFVPGLVVVAQSLGGFTAPIVCERLPVDLLVLVAAMVPVPGETGNEWWTNSGYQQWMHEHGQENDDDDEIAVFYQDVPPKLAAEALSRGRDQAEKPMREPWPLADWPDVPTRFLLCREDRVFPAGFFRGMVRERLGITPDEIDGGHTPALSRPKELADRLEAYRAEL